MIARCIFAGGTLVCCFCVAVQAVARRWVIGHVDVDVDVDVDVNVNVDVMSMQVSGGDDLQLKSGF